MKTDNTPAFTLKVPVLVSEREVWGLLLSGFDSAKKYWLRSIETAKEWPSGALDLARVPLLGGMLILETFHEDIRPRRPIDRFAILHGLELMARLQPRHFADVLSKTADARTGDVFLQLCLFDEVVFG